MKKQHKQRRPRGVFSITRKTLAKKVISALEKEYPDVKCALVYKKPHELLIATRLSAQCTDKRVNIVTPALFSRFKTIDDFAEADVSDVEGFIKSCGLYKTKARDIVLMCQQLRDVFGRTVPDTIEKLTTLAGVGRKTANLIVGDLYGKPAIVTDTHVIRITNRLGLSDTKVPEKVEKELREVVPEKDGLMLSHRLVWHGRLVCDARKPLCEKCVLYELCKTKGKGEKPLK